MQKIPQDTIDAIRKGKQAGESLRTLADRFEISKTSVSYYCRDVFASQHRKYLTEEELRQCGYHRSLRPCRECGTPTRGRVTGLCMKCYAKTRVRHAHKRPLYPCRVCHTSMTYRPNSRCLKCRRKAETHRKAEREQLLLANSEHRRTEDTQEIEERDHRRKAYLTRVDNRLQILASCPSPKSPNGVHFWKINTDNIGTCKYCDQAKDMTTNKMMVAETR